MTGPSYYSLSPTSEEDHRKPRTLVLCFDGTSNEFSERNTNVVKLYSILKKDDPKSQLCYYQARIGTYFKPGVVSPLFRFAARTLDEMFAWYLSEHIMDGYKFLMQNYHEGDSICIFGFSRGAYTARALAGMLHKVGLLSKDNHEQVAFAYKLYKSSRRKDNKLAARFKKVFSYDVPIEFLGVWDTVASVGTVSGRTLPFVGTNDTIKWFRQALSLDERRAKFRPNLHHRHAVPPISLTPPSVKRSITRAFTFPIVRDTPSDIHYNNSHHQDLEKPSESDTNKKILEVWFAGCHCDVGGGNVKDTEQHALSNISLRWMVREILKTKCHILFDETALKEWSIPVEKIKQAPDSGHLREISDSTTLHTPQVTLTPLKPPDMPDLGKESAGTATPESLDADALDAVQDIGDQLKKNAFWWIIEIIPTNYMWQNEQDEWVGGWSINSGRGRKVPSHPRPLFHESVRTRCQDPDLDYVPAARYERGVEEYVV
ncbi:Uncharacterized alpha/beta hydrolase domain (DUF2235) domain containing protein [Lactarius tabidus]